MTAAQILASLEPPCPACMQPRNRGLCGSEYCRREVLPQVTGNNRLGALMAEATYDRNARTLEDSAAEAKRQGRAEALARQAWGGQRRRNRRVV